MNLSGEYSSHFILSSKIEEKNLYIQEILSPAISLPNDKLSVHKVHSSNIKVKIPKFVEIFFEIENESRRMEPHGDRIYRPGSSDTINMVYTQHTLL